MRDQVVSAAIEAGRDPADITCAYNIAVDIGESVEPRAGVVAGPPTAVADTLLRFRELRFTSMNFSLVTSNIAEQAERLATDVLRTLRCG